MYIYICICICIWICIWIYRDFLKWRYPNSWMAYFMENPNMKWMRTGGSSIVGNLHISTVKRKLKGCAHSFEFSKLLL